MRHRRPADRRDRVMLHADLALGGIHDRDGAGAMRAGMAFMRHLNLAMAGLMPGMVHPGSAAGYAEASSTAA